MVPFNQGHERIFCHKKRRNYSATKGASDPNGKKPQIAISHEYTNLHEYEKCHEYTNSHEYKKMTRMYEANANGKQGRNYSNLNATAIHATNTRISTNTRNATNERIR